MNIETKNKELLLELIAEGAASRAYGILKIGLPEDWQDENKEWTTENNRLDCKSRICLALESLDIAKGLDHRTDEALKHLHKALESLVDAEEKSLNPVHTECVIACAQAHVAHAMSLVAPTNERRAFFLIGDRLFCHAISLCRS